jgi:PAS domain S-box-containing protein
MLDPDGVVTNWNAGAERIKGYTANEIIGHNFSRFYTEEDKSSGRPARALEIARREGRFEAEGWRVRKDGSRFWASVVIDVIHDDSGELIGFAKITRDITERRSAQAALKESERQLRLLVNSMTDYALYLLDPNGFVTTWNTGAERIEGYAADEIIGQHFSKFYTEADRSTGAPARALYAATGREDTKARDGGFERTELCSGRAPSFIPYETSRDCSWVSPRSRVTRRSAGRPRPRFNGPRNSWPSPKKWRRSDNSPGASPMISTTC